MSRAVARRPTTAQLPAEHTLKARIAVIAPSIAEVVRFAGGWIVDQGLAGWEVFVLTTDRGDPRPLTILGTRAHDLDYVLASPAAARVADEADTGVEFFRGLSVPAGAR